MHDTPSNIVDVLSKHGFLTGEPAPGMALKLADVAWQSVSDNLSFVPVRTEKQALIWSNVLVEGNQMDGYNQELTEILIAGGLDDYAKMQHLIALLDGKPVASGSVTLANDVAGVFNVAVLPEARRQGIGQLMTEAVMKIGGDKGYQYAVLQSSPMGESLYKKMGYETIAPIRQYIWLPDR